MPPAVTALPGSVVIDASVWTSNILPGDRNHPAAHAWIKDHIDNGGFLVAPALFVVEVAAAIARSSQNKQAAEKALSELYTFSYLRLVPVDQSLIDAPANVAAHFRLRGADSFYVAVAQQLAIPLVTFDREQLTRPASVIATIRPCEVAKLGSSALLALVMVASRPALSLRFNHCLR